MSVRTLMLLTATIAAMVAVPAPGARAQDSKPDWGELNAYALGVQAYIYTFPWSYMTERRGARSGDVGPAVAGDAFADLAIEAHSVAACSGRN